MLGERAHRHGSKGGYGHRVSMRDMYSILHQIDIHFSKGKRLLI
jgi:hypothetical protein